MLKEKGSWRSKAWFRILSIVLLLFLSGIVVWAVIQLAKEIYRSNYTLEVVEYNVQDERFTDDIRMVVLADLHNREFGEENENLLTLVQEQNPDLILCVGDFVIENRKKFDTADKIMQDLVDIAPVYFSMGNHEVHYQMEHPILFEELFESYGVNVLEYEYEDIEIKGQKFRIGGIYGYCVSDDDPDNPRYDPKHSKFLKEYMDTDQFKLLLAHLPLTWLEFDGLETWDIDLTLCGHVHGGLIRIDGIGGVYAPVQGFFPGEVSGEYTSSDGNRRMLLTRGLGSSSFIPRINNVPEIMVVNLGGRD